MSNVQCAIRRLAAVLPLFATLLSASTSTPAAGAPIRFAGHDAELVLSQVSERTLRLELSTLDAEGKPRTAIPSTVLVPFPVTEKFRTRQIEGEKEIRIGSLRVALQAPPLT